MQNFQWSFNAQSVKPADADYQGGWSEGEHPAIIVGHEPKPTKDNNGGYLEFTVQAIEGPHTGTQNKFRLNLWNQSTQAVEIANAQLSAICHATGVYMFNSLDDLRQLYNKPFTTVWKPQKEKPQYTEFRGSKVYAPYQGNGGNGQPAQGNGGQQQQTQNGGGWQPQQTQNQQPANNGWGNNSQTQQHQNNGGWGNNNGGQQQQPAQQQPANNGWGNNGGQQTQQHTQQQPQGNNGGAWQPQGNGGTAGGKPSWAQ